MWGYRDLFTSARPIAIVTLPAARAEATMSELSLQHVCNLIYAFCRFKYTTPGFLPAVVAGAGCRVRGAGQVPPRSVEPCMGCHLEHSHLFTRVLHLTDVLCVPAEVKARISTEPFTIQQLTNLGAWLTECQQSSIGGLDIPLLGALQCPAAF